MRERVLQHLSSGRRVVGIGPMSQNCVESIYSYSQDNSCLIELIASRRQIEAAAFGRGYVNNWTSEEFGAHVAKMKVNYPGSCVVVCRDHGGPWQGYNEDKLSYEQAMERAKKGFESDILSGFDLLHIDPSVDGDAKCTLERTVESAIALLAHCHKFAKENMKEITFEIGTEENIGKAASNEVFAEGLEKMLSACKSAGLPPPLFVVGQTGSLVKEMRQAGECNLGVAKTLVDCTKKHGIFLKEHNADYLSDYQMAQRDEAGIPAVNVAPEFGVIESRTFVDLCMQKNRKELAEKFLNLAVASGKWKKWVVDRSKISQYDIGMMAGHYVFATQEFILLKKQLGEAEFDALAKKKIYDRIGFYCAKRPVKWWANGK